MSDIAAEAGHYGPAHGGAGDDSKNGAGNSDQTLQSSDFGQRRQAVVVLRHGRRQSCRGRSHAE